MSYPSYDRWRELGIRLLSHKYAYYIKNENLVSDEEYDMMEKEWMKVGNRAGKNREPAMWVDFNEDHPWAKLAILLYTLEKKAGYYDN